MKKIISSILLSIILLNCFAPLHIYATQDDLNSSFKVDGDLSYEEGGQVYVMTLEDMLLKIKKEKRMLEMEMNELFGPKEAAYPIGDEKVKVLNITRFEQEKGYYCGPATVKQVLHFLLGGSKSQDYYARELRTNTNGTDMTLIPRLLEIELRKKEYLYDKIPNYHQWKRRIKASIDGEFPAILDIKIDKKDKTGILHMGYDTDGHFINVAGYKLNERNQLTYVKITDPNYSHKLKHTKFNSWIDVDVLYDINMAHFRQAMIW